MDSYNRPGVKRAHLHGNKKPAGKMFECEETSAGFHDLFLNKYADTSGSIMDFFISDSMQDMLDIDIRTEVATVVGSVSEFTSLVNDLPSSIEHDSTNSNEGVISPDRWLGGETKWSGTSEIYADVGACVNPNSVMPLINSSLLNSPRSQINLNTNNFQHSNSPLPSPKESKSHLTFSPNQIKIRPIEEPRRHIIGATSILSLVAHPKLSTTAVDVVKKDLTTKLKEEKISKIASSTATTPVIPAIIAGGSNHVNVVTHVKKDVGSVQSHQHQHNNISSNIYSSNGMNSPKIIPRNAVQSNKSANLLPSETNSSVHQSTHNNGHVPKSIYHEFPKPPYSYSCLIAMALKNSRGGSLPVSEIYSFMCEHFPYFKTARSGWKNSVRHNLSLNKCFEKIEKPATNGGQRKGCLWAMNPSKIAKMDEEVQKWLRKDPIAILDAMICPENLESLERGEMKHGSTDDSDVENEVQSDVEESSDLEGELDEQTIETPESMDDDEEEKFDIEVSNIYEAIDVGANVKKEAIRLTIGKGEIYELSDSDSPLAKKARLDINYSIAPASVFEPHSIQQNSKPASQSQQQQHHNRKKMQLVNRIV